MSELYDVMNPKPGVVVMPVPGPRLARTKKVKLVAEGGLRMHDINRPQPAAALRLPNTLKRTPAGKLWGPTSNRPSRGKHKRSGSANTGHKVGKNEWRKKDERDRKRSLSNLRKLHLDLMRRISTGRSAEARYETARKRHLDLWPSDRAGIVKMEAGQRRGVK